MNLFTFFLNAVCVVARILPTRSICVYARKCLLSNGIVGGSHDMIELKWSDGITQR